MKDSPLTDLVATHILNLIAYCGNYESDENFDKIKFETRLDEIDITDSVKQEILSRFEEGLRYINVGDDSYALKINKPLKEISTVSDLIESVIDAMSDIAKEVSF